MILGLLYPRSAAHPEIGIGWIDGLKAFIKAKMPDADVRLLMESVGFGGTEKEVYEKAEKLLLIEKADILAAYVDLRTLPVLEPLLHSTGKLLLVVNPGANYPYNWVPQPNIIFLTLHHAFLCRLAGLQAAQLPAAKAAMATTFFDCGYLHTSAMVNGFTENGGSITYNYVNNQPYNETFEIKQLTDFLQTDTDTNKLLCAFDSLPAQLFYRQLNRYGQAANLQLFVSPMMLEKAALAGMEKATFSVAGYLPWQAETGNADSREFEATYRAFAKKEAGIFSLPGWETGLIVQQILRMEKEQPDGGEMVQQLKQAVLSSPRGPMHLDDETQYFLTPAVQCTITPGETHLQTLPMAVINDYWQAFTNRPAEGVSSGWTNTYLCY